MHMKTPHFPTYAIFVAINFGYGVYLTKGMENCIFEECIFTGYICKNNKCVCDPDEPAFSRCLLFDRTRSESIVFIVDFPAEANGHTMLDTPVLVRSPKLSSIGRAPKSHGEPCHSDQECQISDYNLHCLKSDTRICKCKRGYIWNSDKRKCLPSLDDDIYLRRFDAVRDLVIPAIIIVTVGAMIYLGFKLFCNCGKLWRRRRHQEITRELEEISATPHQQATWIASYRVFSPYNNGTRPSPGLSLTAFPLIFPTPCVGVFVPSQLSGSPPSYEEALKHKVILSSYQPIGPQLSAYTLPPPDIPRQYQAVAANSSACFINPNGPPPPAVRLIPMSGHRSHPTTQADNYAVMSTSHDPSWNQHPYSVSGTMREILSPQHPSSLPRINQEVTVNADAETIPYSRGPEIWRRQQNRTGPQPHSIPQQIETQSRTSTFRPAHPARIFQTPEPSQPLPNPEIPNS